MTYRYILFDFDGVIIDSEPLIRYAFIESYRKLFGIDAEPPVEQYLRYSGDSFARIMQKLGLPVEEMKRNFEDISTRCVHMVEMFGGMQELLRNLFAAGRRMCLVTGKGSVRTSQLLQIFELEDYFELVICSDMVRYPKPNPESIMRAVQHFGVGLEDCVMVGDSVADIVAAKRAGVAVIGVTWGVGKPHVLMDIGVDFMAESPAQLRRLLIPESSAADVTTATT